MPGKHTTKQKRMAKHIMASCKGTVDECKRIAWATVNKYKNKSKRKGRK